MDWQGLAKIHRKLTLDWHQIGTGLVLDWLELAKKWIGWFWIGPRNVPGLASDWPRIGIWLALDWHGIGQELTSGCPSLAWIVQNCTELGLEQRYYWLGWKVDIGLALSWHRIGQDWHWLARTSHDWPELIMIGNARVPQIHPPSRLRAIPYRRLVLWLRT